MRKISLFAFIFVSASLLSGSYHQTSAIGIDSSSHGLSYGGRVVRRYGDLWGDKNLLNKRYPIGLKKRADPADPNNPPAKAKGDNAPKNADPKPKVVPKEKDDPKAKGGNDPKAKGGNDPKAKNPNPKPKDDNAPPKNKAKDEPKSPPPPQKPKASPTPDQQSPVPPQDPNDTDTTTPPNAASQDQAQPTSDSQTGTPTVATGGLSTGALAGIASIGGVFVLVAGLFAFGQRRKNKEMTKSIVSTSAKAWEQQNSTYEKMEDQAEPIGSYTVIATYTPTLADELDIQPGDKVTILVEFDDGWVQGVNETRGGTKGVFPRHCVDMDHITSNQNIKRSSSMGVYSEKYTEVDLS